MCVAHRQQLSGHKSHLGERAQHMSFANCRQFLWLLILFTVFLKCEVKSVSLKIVNFCASTSGPIFAVQCQWFEHFDLWQQFWSRQNSANQCLMSFFAFISQNWLFCMKLWSQMWENSKGSQPWKAAKFFTSGHLCEFNQLSVCSSQTTSRVQCCNQNAALSEIVQPIAVLLQTAEKCAWDHILFVRIWEKSRQRVSWNCSVNQMMTTRGHNLLSGAHSCQILFSWQSIEKMDRTRDEKMDLWYSSSIHGIELSILPHPYTIAWKRSKLEWQGMHVRWLFSRTYRTRREGSHPASVCRRPKGISSTNQTKRLSEVEESFWRDVDGEVSTKPSKQPNPPTQSCTKAALLFEPLSLAPDSSRTCTVLCRGMFSA